MTVRAPESLASLDTSTGTLSIERDLVKTALSSRSLSCAQCFSMRPIGAGRTSHLQFRDEHIGTLRARSPHNISIRIDDFGRPVRSKFAVLPANIRADHPNTIRDRQGDVSISCGSVQFRASALVR